MGDVTMPIVRGKRGSGRLRAGIEEPLGLEPLLELLEGELERAEPLRLEQLDDELVLAALAYTSRPPKASTCRPSSTSKRTRRPRLRKSTQRSWAASSFSVK